MATVELSVEEKIGVIESHMKNVQYNKYNAQITLIQEQAVQNPDADVIANATQTIAKSDLQIAALQAEIDALAE